MSEDIVVLLNKAYRLPQELRPGETTIIVDSLDTATLSGERQQDRKVIPVTVPIYTQELRDIWRSEKPLRDKRARIAVRIACSAQEQGGVMTVAALAELLHVSPSTMAKDLREFAVDLHVTLPTKGILEDAGPTLTHKDWIIDLDHYGFTGDESSWLTRHAPISRDRYIKAYRNAETIMYLNGTIPEAGELARVLRTRTDIAEQYVELLRRYHPDKAGAQTAQEQTPDKTNESSEAHPAQL